MSIRAIYTQTAHLSGHNLIFLCKQKKVMAFQGLSFVFYITISTKPLWPSGFDLAPQ